MMNFTLNYINSTEISDFKRVLTDVKLSITVVGIISNLICIIVFTIINRTVTSNGQMYLYFLMKSICDFFIFITYLINIFYELSTDQIRNTYFTQFIFIYFYHFLSPIFQMYSIFFEVFATIDCFLSIDNKYKTFLTKKAFYLNSIFVIIFFSCVYSGKLFVYKIIPSGNNEYNHEKTCLYFTAFYRILSFVTLFLRDILGSILCFIFNILIFLNIKKMSERKKLLKNNESLVRCIQAQENKVKMIYFASINHVIFHTPDFIMSIYGKYIKTTFWIKYVYYSTTLLVLSYLMPFFIYILFNKKFCDTFLELIRIKRN
jgi:hypothetical protein